MNRCLFPPLPVASSFSFVLIQSKLMASLPLASRSSRARALSISIARTRSGKLSNKPPPCAATLPGQTPVAGAGERLITINVNGQQRRVDVMKQETLAWTLRYKLGLTSTKLGCDRAECGACTVLIDDVPYYACSMFTHTVRGRKVMTIEGLARPDGTLHPVQQGVIDEQGFQCAFCMSGFIMTTVGFLKTNPNPTRSELAYGVSGNLCRCQDYDKILTAMMRGAEIMRRANSV